MALSALRVDFEYFPFSFAHPADAELMIARRVVVERIQQFVGWWDDAFTHGCCRHVVRLREMCMSVGLITTFKCAPFEAMNVFDAHV